MMPNLLKRILSAAVLLPAVMFVVILGPAWSIAALVALFALLAGFEFGSICFRGSGLPLRASFALLASLCSVAVSLFDVLPSATLAALLAATPISFLFFLFSRPSSAGAKGSVTSSAFAALGLPYCGALLGSVSLLFPITSLCDLGASPSSQDGRMWILLLISGIVASDTFAYAFGRLFGVRKLAPHISPGKTWAGAFGSVFGTIATVLVFCFFLLPDFSPPLAAALGLLLSVFGQLGDLSESLLKRGFSVKDSGNLIPGHGGVLDRVDALLFGAPIVLLFSRLA